MEGVDGAGKTTQLQLLAGWLTGLGHEVIMTREPGGTRVAEQIRSLVLDASIPVHPRTETMLYLAARAEHVEAVIKPAMAEGKIVLCDRFADSTMVYQGFARGIPASKVEILNDFAADGLQPSLTILLDADPEALQERRNSRGVTDRFEQEGLEFQKKLREGFLLLASAYPLRIRKVDALQTPENVQQMIRKVFQEAGIVAGV